MAAASHAALTSKNMSALLLTKPQLESVLPVLQALQGASGGGMRVLQRNAALPVAAACHSGRTSALKPHFASQPYCRAPRAGVCEHLAGLLLRQDTEERSADTEATALPGAAPRGAGAAAH